MSASESAVARINNTAVVCSAVLACGCVSIAMMIQRPDDLSVWTAQLTLVVILAATVLKAMPVTTLGPLTLVTGGLLMSYIVRPVQLLVEPDVVSFAGGLSLRMLPTALAYACALTVAFAAGYLSLFGRRLADITPAPSGLDLLSPRARAVRIALAAIVVVGYLALLQVAGMSFPTALRNPVVFRAVTSAQGIFYLTGVVLWCLWAFFYLEVLTPRANPASRRVLIAVTFVVCAVLTFPFGSRGFLISPILFLILVLQLRKPPAFGAAKLVAVVVCLLVGAGGYGVFRESQAGRFTQAPAAAFEELRIPRLLDRGMARFDSVDFFTWVLEEFPSARRDFIYGRSVLDLVVQPVPRALFPSKSSQTSAWLMEQLVPHYDRSFTPEFGLVAELYINGWIPAVLAGGLLFGVAMRFFESYVWNHRLNDAVVLWYGGCLTLPLGWVLAGVNSFATVVFVMNLAFSGVVIMALRDRRGR